MQKDQKINGINARQLISTSIKMLSCLRTMYGEEEAYNLYQKFTEEFPDQIQSGIMLRLLTGADQVFDYSLSKDNTFVQHEQNWSPKISAIKLMREIFELGLKEAKDIIDAVYAGNPYQFTAEWPHATELVYVQKFKDCGFILDN